MGVLRVGIPRVLEVWRKLVGTPASGQAPDLGRMDIMNARGVLFNGRVRHGEYILVWLCFWGMVDFSCLVIYFVELIRLKFPKLWKPMWCRANPMRFHNLRASKNIELTSIYKTHLHFAHPSAILNCLAHATTCKRSSTKANYYFNC